MNYLIRVRAPDTTTKWSRPTKPWDSYPPGTDKLTDFLRSADWVSVTLELSHSIYIDIARPSETVQEGF